MEAKKILIVRAVAFFVIGIVMFFTVSNKMLGIGAGLACIAVSVYLLLRIKKDGNKPLYEAPVYATPNNELQDLKRTFLFVAISLPLLSIWIAYDLNQLESKAVDDVRILAPIAMLYNHFGYWVAVLALPAFTILLLAGGLRKITKLKADIAQEAFHENTDTTDASE